MESVSALRRTAHSTTRNLALAPSPTASESVYQQLLEQFRPKSTQSPLLVEEITGEQAEDQANDSDLFVYVPPAQPWLQRWLWGTPAQQLVERIATSLLVVPQPRWPLAHILLIVRAEPSDWAALSWIERLAQSGQTQSGQTFVSILPVVPACPRLHRLSEAAQPPPEVLLAPNTVSGAMINQFLQRLHQRKIATSLSLGQGEPDQRIRAAVEAGDPDLIVIAAESQSRWTRWFQGELVRPLLHWVDRPLLIAKG